MPRKPRRIILSVAEAERLFAAIVRETKPTKEERAASRILKRRLKIALQPIGVVAEKYRRKIVRQLKKEGKPVPPEFLKRVR